MESRRSFRTKLISVLLAVIIVAAGCAETSRMSTVPPGGKIRVNGVYLGNSDPVIYHYRSGLPDTYFIEIDKEGYRQVRAMTINRELRADVSLLLLSLVFPYFFSARLEDQYVWMLEPLPDTVPPGETTPRPTAAPAAPADQ